MSRSSTRCEDLDAIGEEYVALFERARAPSLFCSLQFVRTDWVHFRGESDRLFLLAIRDRQQLVGIAPFVIEPEMLLSVIPFRVIKFITEWGDGDKPRILTTQDDVLMWGVIQKFLTSDFTAWDAIALDEQPPDSGVLAQGVFREANFSVRRSPGVWSYRAAIGGKWTEYVAALKGKVRGDWARCKRRLCEHAQPLTVECFEGADDIGQALERYVALERRTWKGGASFSIGGSSEQFAFYAELVQQLAPAGMVAICFLISGTKDAAAAMVFRGGGIVYGAHICYDPSRNRSAHPRSIRTACLTGHGYSVRHTPPLWSYRADIAGDWTDYVRALKGKVRGDWARCRRRLSEHAPPLSFDFFEDPGDIGGALERYVALERQTWKGGAEFSIGGNPGQFAFYKDLVQRLAPEGMVAIGFLTSGTNDAAAAMVFRGGGVVYGAHICYDPSLAKFSPGVILNAEVMKRHFDSRYRFFDFLALQGGDSDSRFKAAWATESQELTGITIYKRGLRFMLYRASHWWRDVRKPLGDRRRGG